MPRATIMSTVITILSACTVVGSASAEWAYIEKKDPFTDAHSSFVLSEANLNPSNSKEARVIFQCKDKSKFVFTLINADHLGRPDMSLTSMELRADQKKPIKIEGYVTTNTNGVMSTNGSAVAKYLDGARKLLLRVYTHDHSMIITEFSLDGSQEPIRKAMRDCNIN